MRAETPNEMRLDEVIEVRGRSRRGFTLIETILAMMLFAIAVVVLASSYVNILESMENVRVDQTLEQELAFVRAQLLMEPDLDNVEKGGVVGGGGGIDDDRRSLQGRAVHTPRGHGRRQSPARDQSDTARVAPRLVGADGAGKSPRRIPQALGGGASDASAVNTHETGAETPRTSPRRRANGGFSPPREIYLGAEISF